MADVIDMNEVKESLETPQENEPNENLARAQKIAKLKEQTAQLNLEEQEGIQEFAGLLMLDDESFSQIAPLMLEKMEQSYNNPEVSQQTYYAFKANGGQVEELDDFYNNLIDNLKATELELSEVKLAWLQQMVGIISNSIQKAAGEVGYSVRIPYEICNENAKEPTYAKEGDAGMDIYAVEDIVINPGETVLVPTGIKMAVPKGYEVQVRPKSGRALRTKLRVANTPGTIDSGYRDEIKVIIENIEPAIKDIAYHFDDAGKPIIESIEHGQSYAIDKGDKFAQLVVCEVNKGILMKVDKITETGNRGGGFGSTGLK